MAWTVHMQLFLSPGRETENLFGVTYWLYERDLIMFHIRLLAKIESYDIKERCCDVATTLVSIGVKLHHRLSWKPHIDYICNQDNKPSGFYPIKSSALS